MLPLGGQRKNIGIYTSICATFEIASREESDMPSSPSRTQNGLSNKESVNTPGGTSRLSSSPLINHNNVFLFIPNIIGYTRVILAASSLYFMRWHPKYCTWLYIVSCLLDAFDGMAARRFSQSNSLYSLHCSLQMDMANVCFISASKFGAVLDMVTDRCTTACLLCYLCSAYPTYTVCFQAIISVDLASHYMHMYRYSKSTALCWRLLRSFYFKLSQSRCVLT